jgi:hypothetical protein
MSAERFNSRRCYPEAANGFRITREGRSRNHRLRCGYDYQLGEGSTFANGLSHGEDSEFLGYYSFEGDDTFAARLVSYRKKARLAAEGFRRSTWHRFKHVGELRARPRASRKIPAKALRTFLSQSSASAGVRHPKQRFAFTMTRNITRLQCLLANVPDLLCHRDR